MEKLRRWEMCALTLFVLFIVVATLALLLSVVFTLNYVLDAKVSVNIATTLQYIYGVVAALFLIMIVIFGLNKTNQPGQRSPEVQPDIVIVPPTKRTFPVPPELLDEFQEHLDIHSS